MTAKYEHIATVTLASATASVTFSSIPQGYRDLEFVINGSVSTGEDVDMYLNSDTNAANYSNVRMGGTGSATFGSSGTGERISSMDVNQGVLIIQVIDYAATDKYKTSLSSTATAQNRVVSYANRWANTSATTSIQFKVNNNFDFNSGMTFDLYGIVGGA